MPIFRDIFGAIVLLSGVLALILCGLFLARPDGQARKAVSYLLGAFGVAGVVGGMGTLFGISGPTWSYFNYGIGLLRVSAIVYFFFYMVKPTRGQ